MSFVALSLSLTLVSRVSVRSFLCLSPLSFHLCSVIPAPKLLASLHLQLKTQMEFPVASLDRWFPVSGVRAPFSRRLALHYCPLRRFALHYCRVHPLPPSHLLLLPSVALKCVYRREDPFLRGLVLGCRCCGLPLASGLVSFFPLRVSLALAQSWAFLRVSHILSSPNHAPPQCLGSVSVWVGDVGRVAGLWAGGSSGLTDCAHRAVCRKASGLFVPWALSSIVQPSSQG